MLTIPVTRYSSVAVWSSHFQIPPFSPFPLQHHHLHLPRGLVGAQQYKFPFIPVAGADDTAALYPTDWRALRCRFTVHGSHSGAAAHLEWSTLTEKQGPTLAQTSVAEQSRWKAAPPHTQTHILNPPPLPLLFRVQISSYYKDLGRTGFCKQKLERSIKRHAGANDVIVVGMSSSELLKSPLWKCDCVCVCVYEHSEPSALTKFATWRLWKVATLKGKILRERFELYIDFTVCVCVYKYIYICMIAM